MRTPSPVLVATAEDVARAALAALTPEQQRVLLSEHQRSLGRESAAEAEAAVQPAAAHSRSGGTHPQGPTTPTSTSHGRSTPHPESIRRRPRPCQQDAMNCPANERRGRRAFLRTLTETMSRKGAPRSILFAALSLFVVASGVMNTRLTTVLLSSFGAADYPRTAFPPSPSAQQREAQPLPPSSAAADGNDTMAPPPLLPPFAGTFPCYNKGESYAAAWLAPKSALVSFFGGKHGAFSFDYDSVVDDSRWHPGRAYVNYTRVDVGMKMEMAFFLMFSLGGGRVHRTVDALEFVVEHWSAYEKFGLMLNKPKTNENFRWRAIEQTKRVIRKRERALATEVEGGLSDRRSTADAVGGGGGGDNTTRPGDRVVAVIPYYASGKSTEGSKVMDTKALYLNATYFSLTRYFSNVVVTVANEADRSYCLYHSGLPFAEVVLIQDLHGPNFLPMATLIEMHRRFRTGEWERFDFAYYTESDQVLHLRPHQLGELLELAERRWRDEDDKDEHPTVVVPHRFPVLPSPKLDFDDDFREEYPRPSNANTSSTKGGVAAAEIAAFEAYRSKWLDTLDSKRLARIPEDDDGQQQWHRCCFDRGECMSRDDWVRFVDDKGHRRKNNSSTDKREAHLFRLGESASMVNGQGNSFRMTFRTCVIQQGGTSCP